MGKYLDLISNMSVENYNLSFSPKNDTVTDAFTVAKQETNGYLGIGFLSFAWFLIFSHISKIENRFNLTIIQSILSTNTLIFSIALMLLYIGVISNIQVFIWCMLALFLGNVWGILRTG